MKMTNKKTKNSFDGEEIVDVNGKDDGCENYDNDHSASDSP